MIFFFFSTGIGEGTGHHPNSVINVAGVNNNMKMYKMIKQSFTCFFFSFFFFFKSDLTDSAFATKYAD